MQNVDFFYKKYPMKNLFDITCGDLRMTRQNYGLFLENILLQKLLKNVNNTNCSSNLICPTRNPFHNDKTNFT